MTIAYWVMLRYVYVYVVLVLYYVYDRSDPLYDYYAAYHDVMVMWDDEWIWCMMLMHTI